MLLHVSGVLSPDQVHAVRGLIQNAEWTDGRITAGTQSVEARNNRQLPETSEAARQAGAIVLEAIDKSALFLAAALPRRIVPPLFNRYDGETNAFGSHVDNAVRLTAGGVHVRTDLAATLFLSDPATYSGGELVVEDTSGAQPVKLAAGDLFLYPASSVHRVEPVTTGTRLASFFWIESMVRATDRRRLLFDLDMSIYSLRRQHGEAPNIVQLTNCYHNLLRMWADV